MSKYHKTKFLHSLCIELSICIKNATSHIATKTFALFHEMFDGTLSTAQKLLAKKGAQTLFCGVWTYSVEVIEYTRSDFSISCRQSNPL